METSSSPKYRYPKLPPTYIRVLELQPSTSPTASLACQLTLQRIHERPYEALSYVWGKPTVFESTIQCQDGEDETSAGSLAITANLGTALLAYRHAVKPRRLWVDAICIKQEDQDERQAQVRMMGDIFHNASQVLCWLGAFADPAADEHTALLAIDFLREFNKSRLEHLQQAQALVHGRERGTVNAVDLTHEAAHVDSCWKAIKVFFDCEYFHRAWIIQEIGLAHRAIISWGRSDICIDWREVAEFVLFLDDNGASVINHLELKSWVCNHINLVWSKRDDGKPIFDFSEVLHWARVHLSTDPRDYVYSLLGHPSAVIDGSLIIEPKYTLSTAEVYTNLAVNTIEKTNSLHILAFVDHSETPSFLDIPTWVPDWHALNLVAPMRYPTQAAAKEGNDITIDRLPGRGSCICCSGFVIDKVCAISDMINPKELALNDYEAETRKTIPFLIDHLYERLVLNRDCGPSSGGNFVHALSSVLTGAMRGTAAADSGATMHQQRSDCAAYILESHKLRITGDSQGFFNSLTAEDKEETQRLASGGSANQFVQDMTWTSMCRKVFRTAAGHIGLGPRILAHGDVCVVIHGSVYPLILRQVQGGHYQLIGPALLYGFMNREAQEVCEVEELRIC